MKNVDELIGEAATLAERGLSSGEIADELNVSRETAAWLVDRSDASDATDGPSDVHVDWSAIGRDGARLTHVGRALADLLAGTADAPPTEAAVGPDGSEPVAEDAVDLTVGVENAGTPLAATVARELGTDLAAYAPSKHQWDGDDEAETRGGFSRNFAAVRGRRCYVVDDIVTTGTTLRETVHAVREAGGEPVACGVVADKHGFDDVEGVPVGSLVTVLGLSTE